MAVAPIFRFLLVAVIARCRSDSTTGYNHNNGKVSTQFGELLKPPPLPLSNIVPVPFHGGSTRSQRQNVDAGYIYQPPPPPPPPPLPPSNDFKFPAPFYKQYNFNFVPPPQPFTTTPSPSLFQKVSGWLFNSQQSSYETPPIYNTLQQNNIAPAKKDCNPCNLVPWIPVLRYNLGAKNVQQNLIPTYGPPSPTAYAHTVAQYRPQSFNSHLIPGIPHAVYGPPAQNNGASFGIPSSTYGPPSPTHTIAIPSPAPPSSTFSLDSSSFIPSSSYGIPSSSISSPHVSSYGSPDLSTVSQPSSSFGQPSSSYGVPSSTYGVPSSTYSTLSSTYGTPSPTAPRPVTNTYSAVTPNYDTSSINNDLPSQSDVDVFKDIEPSNELQLPKVEHPSGFKNSYGEPITNTFGLDNIPFPVSATAAESTKIKTEVLPNDSNKTQNGSLALSNPAPFTLNRGRNIHTLQPVALPNLSVSPLPPIFNARPFRPITAHPFTKNFLHGINQMEQTKNNVNIEQSVPLAEYTHSIDYPAAFVKTTLVDIDSSKTLNQSKAYRNIPDSYIIDGSRDISSQASEDHVEASKTIPDSSFESTGAEFGNDLYDTNLPLELKHTIKLPSDHKNVFADLRGIKDEDVDKYRTESNLQSIDSPLLYLKPSAPHKDHGNFIFAVSTPGTSKDYELYDEIPTTISPELSTLISAWDESRTDYSEGVLPPPTSHDGSNKPKIVQIIVPYTTGQQGEQNKFDFQNNISGSWSSISDDEYQGRKVQPKTENPYFNKVTESYTTVSAAPEEDSAATEFYDPEKYNAHAILNDLYDVKEPPFDIIKLQHTIDDWTEQEYSKHLKSPHKTRTSAKYAKQIPDEYFTTISPITNYVTAATNDNYEFYDHEGSSSIQHSIVDNKNKNYTKSFKKYNLLERPKIKHNSAKDDDEEEGKKPHIYTAASSFRSTTTTPAPWGTIQTSISPLTKEKVYVVTSKPWRESVTTEKLNDWYDIEQFEAKKTSTDNDVSGSDNLPFKSPRFSNRPSFGFTSSGIGSLKADSNYLFSKSWHQSINNLEKQGTNNNTALPGGSEPSVTTNSYVEEDNVPNTDEDTITTTTAEPLETERK